MPAPDEGLEGFCRDQWPRLLRAMWLYCGDADTAEDAAQDALVRAWERWPQVQQMDRPDLWVIRVAFNRATSGFRRRTIEARVRRLLGAPNDAADTSVAFEMHVALLSLPPRQRAAVLLRHGLGYAVRDAAEALGCAEGTVKALTHQGLAALRTLVSEEERA